MILKTSARRETAQRGGCSSRRKGFGDAWTTIGGDDSMADMADARQNYQALRTHIKETATLGSVSALLGWDQETQMPPRAAETRSNQFSLLARMLHERQTSPKLGEMLSAVESSELIQDPFSDAAAIAREVRRSYNRATKLPATLVEEIAKTSVLAHQSWAEARKASAFKTFEPWLSKTVELQRQVADCIGHSGQRYDALLDEYEPGETTARVGEVLRNLRQPLVDLVGRISTSGKVAPVEIFDRRYPRDAQEKLAREASAAIGFDLSAGRLDVSVHPFCIDLGPGDVRITTRYDESDFSSAFFGVLHETGHALYEQGFLPEHGGTPLAAAVSLGIHESQSRMWENLVGRSSAFWRYFYPKAQAAFPDALKDVSADRFLFAINDIRPSLIRTESDEATYNLHVLLRFEIETALLSGDLSVADLPGAWNEKMKMYLGVAPPDDARGCLQDVHWSHGAIGYFPTYTLGNLYSAQFFEQATKDIPDLDGQLSRGQFEPLIQWLRQNIHEHGQRYRANELVQRITGGPLKPDALLNHLKRKAAEYYGV